MSDDAIPLKIEKNITRLWLWFKTESEHLIQIITYYLDKEGSIFILFSLPRGDGFKFRENLITFLNLNLKCYVVKNLTKSYWPSDKNWLTDWLREAIIKNKEFQYKKCPNLLGSPPSPSNKEKKSKEILYPSWPLPSFLK